MVAIEIFKDNSFAEKMKTFIEFCDIQNRGSVKLKLVFNLLKGICLNQEEQDRLKRYSKPEFNQKWPNNL